MDPIIRAATVTVTRRTLLRPGQASAATLVAAVAAVEPVPALQARQPAVEDLRAEAELALARARLVQEKVEQDKARIDAEQATAGIRLDALAADLARREASLEAARREHQEAIAGACETAGRRGYEEGLIRGTAEGTGATTAAVRERLAQLDSMAGALSAAAAAALGAHEEMLVELAWTAICRLAGELAVSRDGVLAMVQATLAQARAGRGARVRVHPDDAGWLQSQLPGERDWFLVADSAVMLGGCIVEDDRGEFDARLELQLERLRDALRAARAARAREGNA